VTTAQNICVHFLNTILSSSSQRRLRASAESADRIVDDHLPRERLHHFGFEKGQLSMLAWQAHRNAQTEAVFAPALCGTSTAVLSLERSA
jgi:hypothetical protein